LSKWLELAEAEAAALDLVSVPRQELRLEDLVSVIDPLEPVVSAAGARVRGRGLEKSEREIRWAVGKKRG